VRKRSLRAPRRWTADPEPLSGFTYYCNGSH